ncbi:MAG TPA: response regulator, partial [Chitinophagaceae bacterium]|nr:response regulator [Chitinophagaceae bacterium]
SSNPKGLSHNIVTSFAEDALGNLWVGTDGGGLNYYDKKTGQFRHYKHQPGQKNSISNNSVLSVILDQSGKVWIGTYGGGIQQLDPATGTFSTYRKGERNTDLSSDIVFQLLEDRNGNIWIGTDGGGVNVLDRKTGLVTRYLTDLKDSTTLSNNDIRYLYRDRAGQIWIGTYAAGLNLFLPETNTFRHFTAENSGLGNNAVFSIAEDRSGNLWVGTLSGGLNVLNKATGTFTVYREGDGLANNMVNYISEDDAGFIWASTNKGLSRFNPRTKTFKNYNIYNGLQGYEFFHGSGLKTRDGSIYFGGINGFNVFDPKHTLDNKTIPILVFTGFQLFNKPVAPGAKDSPLQEHITEAREIRMHYGQSVFTIEYAALNFTMPENNQYAYILENFDHQWNFVGGQRKATYTNLDPGEYIFRVKASNNDGVWNEKGIAIRIVIIPPYWGTWWFRITAAMVIITLAYALYRIRMGELQKQQRVLEQTVVERTESLERKTKEAEEANRAKSVFLATMSHEIRTPMNGVIGTASLLSETQLSPEQRRYTDMIRTSGENLLTVINDILDFSKIESGKMELEMKPFDLRTCIEEVLDVFAGKAAHSGLDLIYLMDRKVPPVIFGDSVRLRQVLLNLVGNALKFTHKGEVFVKVDVLTHSNSRYELVFEVRDTGIGIPLDKLSRLFQAFTQVDSSTTRKYGGTGLGLAISRRLVELMNGSIEVESAIDQGTVFRFTVLTEAAQEVGERPLPPALDTLAGKKILIVDDNETNRIILKGQLELWQFRPVVASSGAETLQLLESQPVDMVITDMQMPEMDGMDLARSIREKHPNLPLVMLSSVGDDRLQASAGLFSAVLTKPVKQQDLARAISAGFQMQPEPAAKEEPKKLLHTDFARQHPMRILIAEDNPVNQTLATMVLKKLGYKPDLAEDGAKAVKALQNSRYDLVLMDVQMPEMDGLEATRAIRQTLHYQPVIIATTANAMQEDRE